MSWSLPHVSKNYRKISEKPSWFVLFYFLIFPDFFWMLSNFAKNFLDDVITTTSSGIHGYYLVSGVTMNPRLLWIADEYRDQPGDKCFSALNLLPASRLLFLLRHAIRHFSYNFRERVVHLFSANIWDASSAMIGWLAVIEMRTPEANRLRSFFRLD